MLGAGGWTGECFTGHYACREAGDLNIELLAVGDLSESAKNLYAMSNITANIHSRIRYAVERCEWLLDQKAVLTHFQLRDMDYRELEQDLAEAFRNKFGN